MSFEQRFLGKTDVPTMRSRIREASDEMQTLADTARVEQRMLSKAERERFNALELECRDLTDRIAMADAAPGALRVSGEAPIYRTVHDAGSPGRNWVKDLVAASKGDADAREALEAHTRMVADLEQRSGLTAFTATAGAEFAGPILTDFGAGALVPRTTGRPYADALGTEALPMGQGGEFLVPEYTTGSAVAATAESGAVTFQDWVSATKTIDVKTIAGGVTVSQQYLDLAPGFANAAIAVDLTNKYQQAFESYVLTSADTNAKGLTGIASTNAVVTTGTDFSVVWRAILAAKQQVADAGSYADADLIAVNGLMLAELIAAMSTPAAGTAVDGRPQGVKWPEGNLANAYFNWSGKFLGPVGTIAGTTVVCSPAVPANAGAGTNESRIYVLNRALGHRVFESPMRVKVASQVGVGTLTPKIVAFGYVAQYSPKPKAVSVISGTAVHAVALTA